jgi:hypothetical protein
MNLIPGAICALAGLTAATTACALGKESVDETNVSIVHSAAATPMEPALGAPPESEYLSYSEEGLAAISPGCRWVRLALYDNEHRVIGWRGDPVGMCP